MKRRNLLFSILALPFARLAAKIKPTETNANRYAYQNALAGAMEQVAGKPAVVATEGGSGELFASVFDQINSAHGSPEINIFKNRGGQVLFTFMRTYDLASGSPISKMPEPEAAGVGLIDLDGGGLPNPGDDLRAYIFSNPGSHESIAWCTGMRITRGDSSGVISAVILDAILRLKAKTDNPTAEDSAEFHRRSKNARRLRELYAIERQYRRPYAGVVEMVDLTDCRYPDPESVDAMQRYEDYIRQLQAGEITGAEKIS